MSENDTNTAVSAAILCLAFCAYDIMKEEVAICSRSVYYIMSQPFFCSSSVKSEPRWLHPEELKFKAKKYFCCVNVDGTTT